MTNPLSRERLEYSLFKLEQSNIVDSAKETIQAALSFLLNPEPTEDMLSAVEKHSDDNFDEWMSEEFDKPVFPVLFNVALSQLTRHE